ncbi:MAG: serine hydrolase domain-containing protein, partial [Thermomicrobiales bacterium]
LPGVPATADMHFRNGAVAISYLSTLLLVLVDDGMCALDDPLAKWLPDIKDSDQVTLRMLSNMTSGYRDYVYEPEFTASMYIDPFRQVTSDEQIAASFKMPRVFAPGTNWEYSHTNCVILGRALEVMTGQPMATLMQQRILDPLGLTNTTGSDTPAIPDPVLHAYSSERRESLGISPSTHFYEESTFWNPSWTLAEGTIQTTNIFDMTASAIAVGEGTLLSPESHAEQITPKLIGFGAPLDGCASCRTMTEDLSYGLGVLLHGPWIFQNPMFSGFAATEGYLPSHKLAVAVSVTFSEASFDELGNSIHGNASTIIFNQIAAELVPDSATPSPA